LPWRYMCCLGNRCTTHVRSRWLRCTCPSNHNFWDIFVMRTSLVKSLVVRMCCYGNLTTSFASLTTEHLWWSSNIYNKVLHWVTFDQNFSSCCNKLWK
jgi:hypothetical protein